MRERGLGSRWSELGTLGAQAEYEGLILDSRPVLSKARGSCLWNASVSAVAAFLSRCQHPGPAPKQRRLLPGPL